MKKLRVLVPVALIVTLLLLLMAPAAAFAAGSERGHGPQGWHDGGQRGHQDGWNDGRQGGKQHGCDGFTYTVRCGDTLGNIAWRFGVNSTYLAQVNGIHNPNRIYAGQALWIPGGCW
jgi:hypothetical protein